ncbi:MAG: hypothetical protein FJ144_03500 [Deltaproteobacteria bacterium]|nr:hypothetical protein [Deltaproteobacteria bacterium]
MISPALAASAASTALDVVSSLTSDSAADRNDVIGQQEFLTLLVTQLQNQDPLNPLDSADFSAQLAQFSSLEQLMQINQRLENLGEDGSSGPIDPVALLGREVTAVGSSVAVESGVASGLAYTLETAGQVSIEISDAEGNVVKSAVLGSQSAGEQRLDLARVPAIGALADGVYSVRLTVQGADGGTKEIATRVEGLVTGVDLDGTSPVLRIGPLEIPLTDVREVRRPTAGDSNDA